MKGVFCLSEAASIGFRAMAYLSLNMERFSTSSEIAVSIGASRNHLVKILVRLAGLGMIDSARGANGGFKLAKEGQKITLLQIFDAIEGPLDESASDGCLLNKKGCPLGECIFSDLIQKTTKEFKSILKMRTLADLQ
jgi:Rrf2 family protein